jgi:formamidopyrimidine-DNA glycosylase
MSKRRKSIDKGPSSAAIVSEQSPVGSASPVPASLSETPQTLQPDPLPEPEFQLERVSAATLVQTLEHVKFLVLDARLIVAVGFLDKVESILAAGASPETTEMQARAVYSSWSTVCV